MTVNEAPSTRPAERPVVIVLGSAMCLLTLVEVNYPHLAPPAQLSLFSLLGLLLCFLTVPAHKKLQHSNWSRMLDFGLAGLTTICFGYVFTQNEPLLGNLWIGGQSLGNRAGAESSAETVIGLLGLVLILEAARRSLSIGKSRP